MTESRSRKEAMCAAPKTRRSCLTSIVKSACEYRPSHPIRDPFPPFLTDNTFLQPQGPYSTTDRLPPTPGHIYLTPSPLPLQVQSKRCEKEHSSLATEAEKKKTKKKMYSQKN